MLISTTTGKRPVFISNTAKMADNPQLLNTQFNKMKIVYIAHCIGGDVSANLADLRRIVREINLTRPDVVPLVPYYADIVSLDDHNPEERERGGGGQVQTGDGRIITLKRDIEQQTDADRVKEDESPLGKAKRENQEETAFEKAIRESVGRNNQADENN